MVTWFAYIPFFFVGIVIILCVVSCICADDDDNYDYDLTAEQRKYNKLKKERQMLDDLI